MIYLFFILIRNLLRDRPFKGCRGQKGLRVRVVVENILSPVSLLPIDEPLSIYVTCVFHKMVRMLKIYLQDLFVKRGQQLRSNSALGIGGSCASTYRHAASKSPWEAECIFPNFPHQVMCGDSWGNSLLILGTLDGVMLLMPQTDREPVSTSFTES